MSAAEPQPDPPPLTPPFRGPEIDRLAEAGPLCPVCGAGLAEQRGKLICPRCHTICETCCEGGHGG